MVKDKLRNVRDGEVFSFVSDIRNNLWRKLDRSGNQVRCANMIQQNLDGSSVEAKFNPELEVKRKERGWM